MTKKISELTDKPALAGTEQLEINDAGTSKRATAQAIANLAGAPDAAGVPYDNAASGLAAAEVQAAIDELAGRTIVALSYALSDESTAITTGTAKLTWRMPHAMTLTELPRLSMTTAPTGAAMVVDVNQSGASILSTELSIDATQKTSMTATTPAVLSDSTLADDAEMTADFDQVGSGVAGTGVKLTLIGFKT